MTLTALNIEARNSTAPEIGLKADARMGLANLVRSALSGSYVLLTKTQAVHWNISGPLFKSVHDLTEDQYKDLFAAIDDLAERIRALGRLSPVNYTEMENATVISGFTDDNMTAGAMIEALADDHSRLSTEFAEAARVAADMGDPATEDMFVERLRAHEKHAWMLRSLIAQ